MTCLRPPFPLPHIFYHPAYSFSLYGTIHPPILQLPHQPHFSGSKAPAAPPPTLPLPPCTPIQRQAKVPSKPNKGNSASKAGQQIWRPFYRKAQEQGFLRVCTDGSSKDDLVVPVPTLSLPFLAGIHGISVRFDVGTRPFASVLGSECVRSRPF